MVEDSEDDALLILHQIKKSGYLVEYERVETGETMIEALNERKYDIILSDYKMPHFDGLEALKILKKSGIDIPFIVISGTIGEEVAGEMMKAGAHDYLMKNNLQRLLPAVEREIRESKSRAERNLLEQKQKQLELERLENLRFFESMDQVNRAMQTTSSPEQMMSDVLTNVLTIFNCDRAWLVYPCDPEAQLCSTIMEITKPEYPGAKSLNVDIKISPDIAGNMREALESDTPVSYTAGTERSISADKKFGVKSLMLVTVYPKLGKPWLFGIHQCSFPRIWTVEDKRLFQEIGRRLSDSLTSLLVLRDLKESEGKYRNLIDNMKEGIFIFDNKGIITFTNMALANIYGYDSPDKLLKRYFWEFVDSSVRDEITQQYKNIMQNKENVFEVELPLIKADGTLAYVLVHPNYIFEGEQIIGTFGIVQDITESKLAEEKLRFTNTILRTQQEMSIDGVLIVNEEGKIISFNKRFVSMWKIPDEIMESHSDHKVLQFVMDKLVKPEEFIERVEYLYKHHEEKSIEEILLKDAVVFERYSAPMIAHEGTYHGRVWFFRDITDRKKAEKELQKRSLAVEQSPVSIIITDLNGNIEYVNPKFTKVTGYSFKESLNNNPRMLNPGIQPKEFYKKLWDTILSGKNWSGIFHNKRKNGELFWESAIISPIKNEEGEITNFVAVKEDITEKVEKDIELNKYREHLEEMVSARTKELDVLNEELVYQLQKGRELEVQLEKSLSKEKEINELKTRFIATVSHEFRTPLASLFASTQMIQRYSQRWSEEKLNKHYNRIESTVKYLTQLLDDMLTISRADREILSNNPEPIEIEIFIQSVLEQLQPDLTDFQRIIFNNELNINTVTIDKKLFSHIIINLLINAIKYSPKGGDIELTISSDNENLIITVVDSGIGIPEDEIKYIFDAFYRTRNSVGIQGSGLGLNIIKRAVEVLGGDISVESKINIGTTFIIRIPSNEL